MNDKLNLIQLLLGDAVKQLEKFEVVEDPSAETWGVLVKDMGTGKVYGGVHSERTNEERRTIAGPRTVERVVYTAWLADATPDGEEYTERIGSFHSANWALAELFGWTFNLVFETCDVPDLV